MMRHLFVTVTALLLFSASSCSEATLATQNADDVVGDTQQINPLEEAVNHLNQRRSESGLTAVNIDDNLEAGCTAHIQYMEATGRVIHEQDANSPFFSTEGAKAAENAALSGNVTSLSDAVEAWLSEPYHRRPLLHPGLSTVGGAFSNGFACLDIFSTANGVKDHAPIPYPGRNAVQIPTTYKALGTANPLPDDWAPPVGTVISYEIPAHWSLHGTTTLVLETADDNEPVMVWIGLPYRATDPYASFQGNTVLAIPKEPLKPDTTYRCRLEGQTIQQVDGPPGPLTDSWTFTTSN